MRIWRSAIVVLSSLLLFACQTIEHRSEVVKKAPLPSLSHSKIDPKLVWSNSQSYGVGKGDAKLHLAVTDPNVVVADYKGNILVLEREKGILKSRQSTNTNLTAGLAIAGDRVFIGNDKGQVLAYRLSDGTLLWQANVMGSVLATPVGNDNVVFVHVLDGSVVALNAEDGQQLWRYAVSTPPLMLRQSSRPVLVNNRLIVGFANGKLKALDRADGSVEWEREIAVSKGRSDIQRMVDIGADPVVKDGIVYAVSYQGKLAAVEVETGALLWERELSSYSGLAVSNHAVFVSDAKGVLWAINRKSGAVLWKDLELSGRRLSAPALIQGYLVVGDDDGHLHWILQSDGSFVGRVLVDNKGIEATPIIKDDIIYVLGRSGKVAAFASPKQSAS